MGRCGNGKKAGGFGQAPCPQGPCCGMRQNQLSSFRVEDQIKSAISGLVQPNLRIAFAPPERRLTQS
jgi:hypothetical protein